MLMSNCQCNEGTMKKIIMKKFVYKHKNSVTSIYVFTSLIVADVIEHPTNKIKDSTTLYERSREQPCDSASCNAAFLFKFLNWQIVRNLKN